MNFFLKGEVLIIWLIFDGWQVFTWGHRLVTPRRVVIARSIKKVGNTILKFHRKERLNVVAISAGVAHSVALTDDGALFYWKSSDPDLCCQQVFVYICTCVCVIGPSSVNEVLNGFFIIFYREASFTMWEKYCQCFCWEILDCCCYHYW